VITLSETPMVGTRRLVKDIEDKLLASLGLLLVSPLLLAVALAIKLDSPGPVFFRQWRTGWDGKTFRIWKFRSMRVETAEADGPVHQAKRDDPRVTRVGRMLRRTSLDELPQLFNVLAGEMSLVGPRPHAIGHNVEYSQQIRAYLARHRVKPGITGLAQVRGLRGETEDLTLMSRRVRADIEYINRWSIWLDFSILVRTLFALTGRNAY
jgi:putative colanic acid biosynthesis UDP-glucose lipid carrier transferase